MQGSEYVFKVPEVRKRWHSLYCMESISDLDEIWEAADSKKGESGFKSKKRKSSVRKAYKYKKSEIVQHNTFGSNEKTDDLKSITPTDTTDKHDCYPKEELTACINYDADLFMASQNKYTIGLLQELNSAIAEPVREITHYQNELDSIHMTSKRASRKEPGNVGSQPWGYEEDKTIQRKSDNITIGLDFDSLQSPNILFVQDESMANAVFSESSPHSPNVHIVQDQSVVNADSTESSPQSPNVLIVQEESMVTADYTEFSPQSPNVLIVRDESMVNADVEWESLTPPSLGTLHDYTVPDLSDLNSITPSDFLLSPSDPFSSAFQMEDRNISEDQGSLESDILQTHPRFAYSELDHFFPDFYS